MKAILRSLARNTATSESNMTILRDVTSNGNVTLSLNTLLDYIEVLREIYIVEDSCT